MLQISKGFYIVLLDFLLKTYYFQLFCREHDSNHKHEERPSLDHPYLDVEKKQEQRIKLNDKKRHLKVAYAPGGVLLVCLIAVMTSLQSVRTKTKRQGGLL